MIPSFLFYEKTKNEVGYSPHFVSSSFNKPDIINSSNPDTGSGTRFMKTFTPTV